MYRDCSDFKKSNQLGTNIVKDDKFDLVADYTIFRPGGMTIFPNY